MHNWGDEWFNEHGDDLYTAIDWIERNLRKNGIKVCGKEKWGCYRDDFLCWWDGSLSQLLFGVSKYIRGPLHPSNIKWMNEIKEKLYDFVYWRIDLGWTSEMMKERDNERFMKLVKKRFTDKDGNRVEHGLKNFIQKTKFYRRFCERKREAYNKVFQLACKKWPELKDELISDIDGWEWIKPCKWGDVDGEEIHKKYWKTIQ